MTLAELVARPSAAARRWPPAFLWAPALLVAAAALLPLGYLLVRASQAGTGALELLARERTAEILGRSVLLAFGVTALAVFLAVPIAWLTVRSDLPWRRGVAVLASLPLAIPSYVGAFTVVAALGPGGLVEDVLGPLGARGTSAIYGYPGAVMTLGLLTYPYVLLTARAALRGLDPALEEASRGLGKGSWGTFWRVVLPQLRPAIGAGALLVALYTLSDFGAVSLLRFDSFTRVIYVQYQSSFDRTGAAVLALTLVALTLFVLLLEANTRGVARYQQASGGQRRGRGTALGRWKWPALAWCATVALVALGLPVSVLGYWFVRGLRAGEPLAAVGGDAWRSLFVAGLAAGAAALASLPVAALAVRYPGRLSRLLERVSYLGYALPGIVVALALVFFGARYAWPVYQTLGMLILAYVVLFLPQAVGATRASLLQIRPSLEEAARGLGRSRLSVLATITAPLAARGLLAGAALVFLTTLKELPATLLLSPIGFTTLATSIWGAASEAFFARAAAPALLLILLSALTMAAVEFWQAPRRKGRERL